jgi:hypothetical protein
MTHAGAGLQWIKNDGSAAQVMYSDGTAFDGMIFKPMANLYQITPTGKFTQYTNASFSPYLRFDEGASGGVVLGSATTDGTHKVGFHGAAPIAKQTITGSRGGNAALADLLTKLAAKGLIIDSTSA